MKKPLIVAICTLVMTFMCSGLMAKEYRNYEQRTAYSESRHYNAKKAHNRHNVYRQKHRTCGRYGRHCRSMSRSKWCRAHPYQCNRAERRGHRRWCHKHPGRCNYYWG